MINDDELIEIFIEESRDLLNSMLQNYKAWIASRYQTDLLAPIMRELHTLKGNSRMIGLTSLSELLHCLEQLIQQLHYGNIRPNDKLAYEVNFFIDYLKTYIDDIAKTKEAPSQVVPIDRIKAVLANPQQANDVMAETEFKRLSDEIEDKPASKANTSITPSDFIRVRADALEKFGQLAGQVNIARSHLDQQLKAVYEAVSDMAKEIKVIQEKMKNLQTKTDANMRVYHAQDAHHGYEEFDILEMDRYSLLQQSTRTLLDKLNQLDHNNRLVLEAIRGGEILLSEQGRAAKKLEEDITHTRLVSLEFLIPRLERIVKQISAELGKEVKLEFNKVEGEVDRKILEHLIPSLEHMVRNAVDHGIEFPDTRVKNGKPPYGVITLALYRQSSEIVIELTDDGQGIDIDKVKAKALEKMIWDGDTDLSRNEIIQLIFLPGFTTKDEITEISGHGVGMDVVNTEINKLGGTLRVETQRNLGTRFTIRLPFTLSLSKALVFYVGSKVYAIPLSHLVGVTRLPFDEIKKKLKDQEDKIHYADRPYELFYLPEMIEGKVAFSAQKKFHVLPIIFVETNQYRAAFVIDKLMGSCEVVIKPAGVQLQFVKEICGVSVLGNGQIVLILDAQYLIQSALAKRDGQHEGVLPPPVLLESVESKTKVLVVDDSNTVRQVTARLLRRHQYQPLSAKNGEDAFLVMSENTPDIILLDIEMPNMDGYEVLEKMRSDRRYRHIPVIMITSRSGEKHRLRAMKMGANEYLSKPYREEELLALLAKYHQEHPKIDLEDTDEDFFE